jgi:alginate O-acetyltransferase complex protein AlgI
MESISFQYLGFAFAVVLIVNLFSFRWWREAVLLIASILFIALCSSGLSCLPFAAFLAAGYAGLRWVQAGRHRGFAALLIGIVALFMWLKKYLFFPTPILLQFPYLTLGLSYILFRVLHLVIEARQGLVPERVGIISYLNYTINFTTLVSGPIQRYEDFSAGQRAPEPWKASGVGEALERIVVGCCKVNVVGFALSTARSTWVAMLSTPLSPSAKCLAGAAVFASYPLFLYCNFSGYIDVTIGIARLLGFRLPENFARPFAADSFIGFWSRWHITLSEWLRTYVYNPLLMTLMRKYPSQSLEPVWAVSAFFVTFFLIGFWHGQTSVFLFFGFLQGLGVSVNKLYQILMAKRLGRKRYKAVSSNALYIVLARGLTFTWFAFTLIWFWSNWRQIGSFVALFSPVLLLAVWASIFVGAAIVLAAWEKTRNALLAIEWQGYPVLVSRYTRTAWCTALLMISVVVMLILSSRAPDIVYKAF